MVVDPGGGLDDAVLQKRRETGGLDADAADLLACLVLDDGVADLLVQDQQLEDADPAAIARVLALRTALAFLEPGLGDVGGPVAEALKVQRVGR
jgi:hypothetical protein